jgi:hypothetical protein
MANGVVDVQRMNEHLKGEQTKVSLTLTHAA